MKYIRTKNGIYEVVEDNNKEWGKQIVVKFPKNLNMKLADVKDQILKQSDNIEELCDEFVVVNNTCFNMPQLLGTEIDKDYYKHEEVYGAIWTDKGLIYVAKMNDKGELELI